MAEPGALDLDFLIRVVSVHWEEKGAVFVAGGYAEFVLYTKIENKDDPIVFLDLGHLDAFTIFGGGTLRRNACNVLAGSCREIVDGDGKRKVTFILGGNDERVDDATGTSGSGSVITVSHDGKNWTTAFRKRWGDNIANTSGVQAFAWDSGQFYGYVTASEYYYAPPDDHTAVKSYDRLLASSDGESWVETSETLRNDSEENTPLPPTPNTDPPALFLGHLNPVAHLPDGKYGYQEKKDDDGNVIESYLVAPTKFDEEWYFKDTFYAPPYGSSIDITILKDATTTRLTKDTPIEFVTCAAFAAGILMVGGASTASGSYRAKIAASVDDGDTWNIVFQGEDNMHQAINTITGAQMSASET